MVFSAIRYYSTRGINTAGYGGLPDIMTMELVALDMLIIVVRVRMGGLGLA